MQHVQKNERSSSECIMEKNSIIQFVWSAVKWMAFTDWNMFKQAATYNNTTDLQEYSETVTAYITKCIDDVTVTKTITVRANQKPWLTGEVYRLLKAQNVAFRAGDEEGLKTARANLSRGIREAKRQYSRRIAHRFSDSRDTRSLWQGIQTITDYKPPPQTCDSTIPLLNELNAFFAHFEAQNSTTAQKTPPPPGDQVMTLFPDSVRRSLSRINARKAPGPDNIPGRVLRDCAVELTDVFTDIFNISLSQAVVPTCFKATTIIPVPKKSSPSCFNDYRPVALTPILMKCFERLVMQHIKSVLPPSLDPFQFAYRSNRSTDDAIATALHPALTHLDKKDSYVRMLFIDFSSAFNTIIPQQLTHKLVQLGLNTSLCNWLLDFLTGRPQAVRVGINTSSTITLNTGAHQGCVLSPLLFTLLTHDCTPSHNSNLFIKFADDTTVVGLISNRDETNYRSEVSRLAGWCRDNNLSLNVEKTKEIVVDFRRVHTQHAPLTINGATVERVSSTKFLGVHITEDLSWTNNTAALAKKAQQCLYFLRKLRRARAPTPIMCTFYRGTTESILTSCITVWYGACNASCRKSLQRMVRAAEKIVGVFLLSLQDIYSTRLTRKALCIAGDPTHPTHNFFSLLPSGRRLRSLQARTNRLKDSFIHQAVRKLNSLPSLPPLPSFTPRNTELWHYDPPPPAPHIPRTLTPPPHLQTVTRTSHFVQHWTDHYLIQHWLQTTSSDSLIKDCSFSHYTYVYLHSFVLFNWFALYLPCALCHFIYLFFYFSIMSSLYICIVCMYICLNCIYLYLNVYCQCLMLTVCTKGLSVTQFQFSLCMCWTCGRIDNKADLTWLALTSMALQLDVLL